MFPRPGTIRAAARIFDSLGRGYVRMSDSDRAALSLPAGIQWFYCVLPIKRAGNLIPRLGSAVGPFYIHRLGPGFVRRRTVGAVALR
jgi:hypothetical protein